MDIAVRFIRNEQKINGYLIVQMQSKGRFLFKLTGTYDCPRPALVHNLLLLVPDSPQLLVLAQSKCVTHYV